MDEYDPGYFEVDTLERVKAILCPALAPYEPGELWDVETECLVDLIVSQLPKPALALDFGCGVGRIAKILHEEHGWELTGCDQSAGMRRLARQYFPDFTVLSPKQLLRRTPAAFDAAISIFTMDCCFPIGPSIELLRHAIQPQGALFVTNPIPRYIPKKGGGFFDDGVDVFETLSQAFMCIRHDWFNLPPFRPDDTQRWWWGLFKV